MDGSMSIEMLSCRPVSKLSTYQSPIVSVMLDPLAQEGYKIGCVFSPTHHQKLLECAVVGLRMFHLPLSEEVVLYPLWDRTGSRGDAVSPR